MTLGSSTSQGASASSISQQRVSAYEALIGSLQNFGGEEGLTGAAYDSAKNYATSILVPLLQGAILLSEGIGQAVPRLPQKYQAEVGGEDLDSAVLESEIAAYNSSLRSQHNLLRMLSSADEISPSAIQRVSQGITNTTKLRNDAMEKLQKLNAFANSSNSVFDGVVSDVEGAVQAGLAEIGSSFASFNGTFSSSSPSWAKSIKKEWKARQAILDDYNRVLKNWEKNGDVAEKDIEVLKRYIERYPDRELPEGLKNKIQEYELIQEIYTIAIEKGISVIDILGSITAAVFDDKVDGSIADIQNVLSIYEDIIKVKNDILFINGREVTVDLEGRVKVGSRFLYNRKTDHIYTNGSVEYNQKTGEVLDIEQVNIGKGVGLTGWRNALGDSARSGWRNSISALKIWKDFDWRKASELSKLDKFGKAVGAVGTVINVGTNIKENFFDDQESSVAKKIRNFAVDQGVDLLSGAGAAGVGAAVGTFIGGPIGTAIGFGVGAGIGWMMDNFKIKEFNQQSVTDMIKGAFLGK